MSSVCVVDCCIVLYWVTCTSSEGVAVVNLWSAILKWEFDFCLLLLLFFSVTTPAVESGAGESVSEVQAPTEAVQEEEEEVEEERAEPREGEGEWQQISVPVFPPGVLEVGALRDEWGTYLEGGGDSCGPFEAQVVLYTMPTWVKWGQHRLECPLLWSLFSWVLSTTLWHYPVEEHLSYLHVILVLLSMMLFLPPTGCSW